jgi:hypothetical protein
MLMSSSQTSLRRQAIRRGLEFIYRTACDPVHFAEYGSDLLSCFCWITLTSRDAGLRAMARKMGDERASQWRRDHQSVPPVADADTISFLVYGSYAAHLLGFPDQALKKELQRASGSYPAQDYLWFDPVVEPPPGDVPEQCKCGLWNKRGAKRCRRCRKRLTNMSRYKVWYYALTTTFTGDRYGVKLGAHYRDVLKWLPAMRPYRGCEADCNPDFYDTVYAITHIIYTLNDYSAYQLSPDLLPQEFAFLKTNLKESIRQQDPETVGEFLDALRAFGLTSRHSLIRMGLDYLLAEQNSDGSWGAMKTDDIYARYHPTWTAIDGLREYAWRGEGLSFPKLKPWLNRWAGMSARGRGDTP